ncbi:MAG: phenylacetate-CoA oxygenase subunit PaaC [SAR324 cluster bacterium]|nr:phenylacetate-CoA oxygenase subunit PaaC [SAR324 cluster bacterium]
MELNMELRGQVFDYLLRHADDRLVLGHRLSEWCGHAPMMEEDLALANIALDLIGQATLLYKLAAKTEGSGRTEDDLAFLRDPSEFRNLQLVEQPNGDFADTIARQFFFDSYDVLFLEKLSLSAYTELAGIAAKALKEAQYHLRHAQRWMLRLGDGTEESHNRLQDSVVNLWCFSKELFVPDNLDHVLVTERIGVDLKAINSSWRETVTDTFREATLDIPGDEQYFASGSRGGYHTEHLGFLLAEMQVLQRTHPGAIW